MSLRQIRDLVTDGRPVKGQVTAIRGGQMLVATPAGIRAVPVVGGVGVGDEVRVSQGVAVRVRGEGAEVYFL